MKLTDLEPEWTSVHGKNRRGLGVAFLCPRGCGQRLELGFANPLDGLPPDPDRGGRWQRTGDTFATLTLTPSVNSGAQGHEGGCKGWHGFITDGSILTCR